MSSAPTSFSAKTMVRNRLMCVCVCSGCLVAEGIPQRRRPASRCIADAAEGSIAFVCDAARGGAPRTDCAGRRVGDCGSHGERVSRHIARVRGQQNAWKAAYEKEREACSPRCDFRWSTILIPSEHDAIDVVICPRSLFGL